MPAQSNSSRTELAAPSRKLFPAGSSIPQQRLGNFQDLQSSVTASPHDSTAAKPAVASCSTRLLLPFVQASTELVQSSWRQQRCWCLFSWQHKTHFTANDGQQVTPGFCQSDLWLNIRIQLTQEACKSKGRSGWSKGFYLFYKKVVSLKESRERSISRKEGRQTTWELFWLLPYTDLEILIQQLH